MDCYRLVGEDKLERTLAEEGLRAGTDFDGTELSPIRNADPRVTLGVAAAREGDLEQALTMGERALESDRRSVPSLIMTSRELAAEMKRRYVGEPAAHEYLARLQALGQEKPGFFATIAGKAFKKVGNNQHAGQEIVTKGKQHFHQSQVRT